MSVNRPYDHGIRSKKDILTKLEQYKAQLNAYAMNLGLPTNIEHNNRILLDPDAVDDEDIMDVDDLDDADFIDDIDEGELDDIFNEVNDINNTVTRNRDAIATNEDQLEDVFRRLQRARDLINQLEAEIQEPPNRRTV
jgi:hypothetical protein